MRHRARQLVIDVRVVSERLHLSFLGLHLLSGLIPSLTPRQADSTYSLVSLKYPFCICLSFLGSHAHA